MIEPTADCTNCGHQAVVHGPAGCMLRTAFCPRDIGNEALYQWPHCLCPATMPEWYDKFGWSEFTHSRSYSENEWRRVPLHTVDQHAYEFVPVIVIYAPEPDPKPGSS